MKVPGGVPGLCFSCQVKLVNGVKGRCPWERGCLVFRSRWRDPPSGEGENIEEDQVHEGEDHEDAKDAWEACLTEYLPVRNDEDQSGHENKEHDGEHVLVHHSDVGLGRLVVLLAHGPE